jgi:hypothetical protein
MYDLTLAYEELNSLEKRITYLEEQTAVGKEVTVELVETIIAKQNVEEDITFFEEESCTL